MKVRRTTRTTKTKMIKIGSEQGGQNDKDGMRIKRMRRTKMIRTG